jgi:hypothetical protein
MAQVSLEWVVRNNERVRADRSKRVKSGMDKKHAHPACLPPAGTMPHPAGVIIVDKNETNESLTKRHHNGWSLTMLAVNGVIAEKDMTYKMLWDLEAMKKEERNGADGVSCKHWEKGVLSVRKSCC